MATEQARRLAQLLEQSARQYDKLNIAQQAFAVREIGRTRLELTDLLTDYAKKDNTISRARLNSLLRDLDGIEASIRKNGMDAMSTVIRDSAAFGTQAGERALMGALGNSAALGVQFNRMNAESVRYVATRFSADGLVLSDRVWQIAGDQRDALNTVIRSGIIRGESVNTLTAQVRAVYDNETWKIRRLVRTEGNVAYRTGTAYRAQRSDNVKGLRIHKGLADRPEHECTILAEADDYGLGVGVYPADNTDILSPHPNCTSYTTYELTERTEDDA
jgi:hypothetical protein